MDDLDFVYVDIVARPNRGRPIRGSLIPCLKLGFGNFGDRVIGDRRIGYWGISGWGDREIRESGDREIGGLEDWGIR